MLSMIEVFRVQINFFLADLTALHCFKSLVLSQFDLLVHEGGFIDSYFLNPCSTVDGKLLMEPIEREVKELKIIVVC